MNRVVIIKNGVEQTVFVGPYFACEQYVNTVHPNGKFTEFNGEQWDVEIR